MTTLRLVFFLCLLSFNLLSQDYYPIFELSQDVSSSDKDKVALQVIKSNFDFIKYEDVPIIRFHLPISDEGYLELVLSKRSIITSDGLSVTTSAGYSKVIRDVGQFYHGQIVGQDNSKVSLAIYDNDIRMRIRQEDGTGYVLHKKESRLANDTEVSFELVRSSAERPSIPFYCGNTETEQYAADGSSSSLKSSGNSGRGPLTVYLEIDYETFVSMGGDRDIVIMEMTDLFLNVATYFDQVNCNLIDENGNPVVHCLQIQLSELFIHETPDGYPDSVTDRVIEFVNSPTNAARETDIAQLIRWTDASNATGGISNGIGNLCGGTNVVNGQTLDMNGESIANLGKYELNPSDPSQAEDYPELIMAHEMAHSMGAFHTGANTFYSSDDQNCPGHRYAIESESCDAVDNFLCPDANGNTPPSDPPRSEPDGQNSGNGLEGRTVTRICPTTIMSYCWAFNGNDNSVCTDADGNDHVRPIAIDTDAPIHPQNVIKICEHLNACSTWGEPGCMTETDPPLPDADCDGIADEDECLLYTNVSNGLIDIVESINQCPYEEIIETVQSCNDNDDCTFNDHLDADCNCIGTPMSVDIPDPNNGLCINNAGQCRILNQVYGGEDQSRGGLSQYPVRWQGGGGITTPDIIDGHVRVRGISYNTAQDHEGIVLPLCCPLKNDGGGYQLQLDAAFLPIYNGLEATLLVQASMDAPSIDNPLNRDCTASGDYICLGEIELTDNMISAHPTRIQNCRDEEGDIIGTEIIPDEFWYLNSQTVDYTMEPIVFNLDFGQAGNVSCGSDINQYNFIYLSILIEGDNPAHTNDNNIFQNCGGLQFRGGGSLLMNNINIFKLEPPINLERHSMIFDACTEEEEEEIEPVTNFDIGPTNCGFEICKGDDFMLCVTDIMAAPFCIPIQNIVWQRVDSEGNIICPEDRQFGECFEIQNFSRSEEGFVRLTVTDNACNCTNEVTLSLNIRKSCPIYCRYQVEYSECNADQYIPGNPSGFSPIFNVPPPAIENNCEVNPNENCHLLMCPDDYNSIHFYFGDNRTVTFYPFSSTIDIDPTNIGRDCDVSILEQDKEFCQSGNFQVRGSDNPFGVYIVTDNICSNNMSCFVIEEDTPPEFNVQLFECNNICMELQGDNEHHSCYEYTIDGGITWSDENCYADLMPGTYTIGMRWCDVASCCTYEELVIEEIHLGLMPDIDHAICDGDNGGIDLCPTAFPCPSDYTFLWDDGDTQSYKECIGAGTYNVTVTDGNGCTEALSFVIFALAQDLINESGGSTGLIEEGIKIPSGTTLSFKFNPAWIADQLKIYIDNSLVLDTGPITRRTQSCCGNSIWCNCSHIYMGEVPNQQVSPLFAAPGIVVKTGLIEFQDCSDEDAVPLLLGDIYISQQSTVRIEVIGQPCNPNGEDFTLWNLVVSCDPSKSLSDAELWEFIGKNQEPLPEELDDYLLSAVLESSELELHQLTIYPVPSPGIVKLDFTDVGLSNNLELYNSSGLKVGTYNNVIKDQNLDLSTLNNGTYFAKLNLEDGKSLYSRFVIIR